MIHSVHIVSLFMKLCPTYGEQEEMTYHGGWDKPIQVLEKKGRYMTQSYDESPYTHRKKQKSNVTTQKRQQKLRLYNDCSPTYSYNSLPTIA